MRRIATVAIAVAGMAIGIPAQAQQFNFEGCPFYSDQGCTLIRGADGITYNITSARPQPRIRYRPIRGSGWAAASLDICFAKPLDRITWRYTRQRCR